MDAIKTLLKKKSVENGLWLYILQFFNTIIPLMTLPYVTRILGPTQYGVFSLALNIVMYLQVFVEYGFALSATRKVAINSKEMSLNKLFTSVIVSRFVLYIISVLIMVAYVLIASPAEEELLCLIVLTAALVGYCFQLNWLFQGKQEMKFISITNVLARTISTIAIFVFVKSTDDVVLYCFLYSISPIFSNLIGFILASVRYNVKFVRVKFLDVYEALKDGVYIFFTQLSSKVFSAIGVTFLGFLATDYEVGIYSAIYKIPYILMLFWTPISQILYPISSKHISESYSEGTKFIKKAAKYCLCIFVGISVVVAVLAKPIIGIVFGDSYASYYYLVYPLLMWMVLGIENNFLGVQTLVGSGHDSEYSKCFQVGVVATIVFNFTLIYCFGIFGAAIAPMASELLLTLLLLFTTNNVKKNLEIKI